MRFILFSSLFSATACYTFPLTPRTTRLGNHQTCLSVTATIYDDDIQARSAFGTKAYWDDVYQGMGDFPKDEYSWYYGYDVIKPHLIQAASSPESSILLPGIGNDPIVLDLHRHGYRNLVAFDYSEHAIERQKDLLSYEPNAEVELHQMDARFLKRSWTDRFDVILEKGALDAIYLSGDGNAEASVQELNRVLKPGGTMISISGVLPDELRRTLFADYTWIRDGSKDLRAGCFVFRKPL
jgi:SAM-dependent methyltransferase